ncbi:LysM domain-containing protein [Coprinopsis sp. MPI-PUGE-AT-0042]|nr:LysM domain-containing protein [Coprinopsis sp. MPI-PUGE-AT-0042]
MHPDDLDLTYNPFDDDGGNRTNQDELTDRGKQYFGSAFMQSPGVQVMPAVSRRRSSAGESSAASGSTMRRRHKRSRSDLRLDLHEADEPSPASGHPLKSAAMKTAEFLDGITRPYLSKLVQSSSINNDLFGVGNLDPVETLPRVQEPTTEVLVSPSDSLPGVSLKYGIDLIELRRANQLWANDSIHLRETLLIPLHRAVNARAYVTRAASEDSSDVPDLSGDTSDTVSPIPPPASGTNVRRVPISQLSGFPPSSNPHRSIPSAASTSPSGTSRASASTSPSKPGSLSRNNTLTNHSLSSFLNALPIAASTRDEITSRLSMDSATSSQSDRRASSEDSGHEMKNVHKNAKWSPSGGQPQPVDLLSGDSQTPRVSHRTPKRFGNKPRDGANRDGIRPSHTSNGSSRLSTSPPAAYVPHVPNHTSYVRTSQMEPSPGMKLPLLRSNSDGHRPLDLKLQPFDTTSHVPQARHDPIRRTNLDVGPEIS